ncbi:M28 family peptidase, partial [bacterium]|nr:M28 family peptidase [bacterium]
YGISEPSKGWDDYAGMDVKGKIVLIQRGLPQDGQEWAFANERFYKVRTAEQKGAVGLLMLDRGDWPMRGVTIAAEGYQPHMPIFNISKKVARDLFTGCYKNIDHLLRDLAKKPQSFSLNRRMAMTSRFELAAIQEGENVLAMVRGTDPVLADEYLVVGAHMDHNGLSLDGHLYAGADDNASGAAVVMEMARVITQKNSSDRSFSPALAARNRVCSAPAISPFIPLSPRIRSSPTSIWIWSAPATAGSASAAGTIFSTYWTPGFEATTIL